LNGKQTTSTAPRAAVATRPVAVNAVPPGTPAGAHTDAHTVPAPLLSSLKPRFQLAAFANNARNRGKPFALGMH
jgi:hypothetical protein